MATPPAKDKKAAHRAYRSCMRLLNKTLKETDKVIMEIKRANKLKRRNTMLANMVKFMHDKGASEQTIRRALTGLDEFAKFASREGTVSASRKPDEDAPAPDPEEEALG